MLIASSQPKISNFVFFLLGILGAFILDGMLQMYTRLSSNPRQETNSIYYKGNTFIIDNSQGGGAAIASQVSDVSSLYVHPVGVRSILKSTAHCMANHLSLKKPDWNKELTDTMKCIESCGAGDDKSILASLDDVDYSLLENVYFDPKKLVLRVQKSKDIPLLKQCLPRITIEDITGDEIHSSIQWTVTNPVMVSFSQPSKMTPDHSYLRSISVILALLNTQLYSTNYPLIHSLLLPTITQSTDQFPESLLSVVASMRSKTLSLVYAHTLHSISKNHWIRFSSLMILGSMHHHGIGGIVQHVYDFALFKASIYKYYGRKNLQREIVDKRIQATYITRIDQSMPLQRINQNAIDYSIKKLSIKLAINQPEISMMESKEILSQLYDTDVLIGVSGPVMTLAIFMKPQSAILEILPKGEKTAMYSRMAVGFDMTYYSHHQIEASVFEKDATGPYEAYIDEITLWIIANIIYLLFRY